MNQIPHTISAPNAGQVMREAIVRTDARKQQRRDWLLNAAVNAMYFVLIVLGVVALAVV